MIDPARCETHRVVLTSSGVCLLCERRAAERSTGSALRKLAAIAGALVLVAAAYRAYGMFRDARDERARAMRIAAERAASESAVALAPAVGGTSTSMLSPAPTTQTAAAEARNASLLDQARLVEAQRSVSIDLYGEGWCPSCKKARAWLDAQGIAYTYRDTSDAENKRTMRALNPQSTIPTINIDGRILVGFSASRMQSTIQAAARARAER